MNPIGQSTPVILHNHPHTTDLDPQNKCSLQKGVSILFHGSRVPIKRNPIWLSIIPIWLCAESSLVQVGFSLVVDL